MGQMTGQGLPQGIGGMNGMNDPTLDGLDDDENWRAHALMSDDVGKTFALNTHVKKRLISAKNADPDKLMDFIDNPRDGWEVDIDYEARVMSAEEAEAGQAASEPFEQRSAITVALGQGALPHGVEQGICSMRLGETSAFTVLPGDAFGTEGDATLGVPPNATVEYRVTMNAMYEALYLDEERKAHKKRLVKGKDSRRASWLDVVTLKWSGRLVHSDGELFQKETDFKFTVGDASVPPAFNSAVTGKMTEGEVAEITVSPTSLAEAAPGFAKWGVPVGVPVVLRVTLHEVVEVEDVSKERDGTWRKRVLRMGSGWEKPRSRHQVACDLEVRTVATAAQPTASWTGIELTLGSIATSIHLGEISAKCGAADGNRTDGKVADGDDGDDDERSPDFGADLAAALEVAVPRMAKGETCELLRHPPTGSAEDAGFDIDSALSIRLTCHGWTVIDPVPLTDNAVLRRVVIAADESEYERPNSFASVCVQYVVRRQAAAGQPDGSGDVVESTGTGASFRRFVLNEGPSVGVLPCIDAAVKEMKHGETSIISAPASWAYGSPEYVPPAAPPAAPSAANGVSADGTVDEGDAELVEVSDAASNAASDAVAAPIDRSSVGDVEVRLTLLSFERGKEIYQMTGGEKLAKQAHFKQQGNRCYQGGNYDRAIKLYEEANRCQVYDKNLHNDGVPHEARDVTLKESHQMLVSCYLNLGMCHLKLGDLKHAELMYTEALKRDETNVKASFRRGQVRLTLGDIDGARSDLYEAAKRDPQNREVRKELEALKKQDKQLKQEQKGMFGGMFGSKAF